MTEFVRVAHPDITGEAEVPVGALEAYTARGWEAVSEPRSYSRLADEETIRAQEDAAKAVAGHAKAEEKAGDTIPQVLKRVGDDPEKAAEALRVENKRAQPRVTLVADLERIAGNVRPSGSTENEE